MNTHVGRLVVAVAALAFAGATASVAHDPNQDVARKQREIDELRTEKNALQDQNIELARRFDTEKLRLQREKDELLKQSALDRRQLALMQARLETMERQQGGAAPAGSPLDGGDVTINFSGTTLEEAMSFFKSLSGMTVDCEGTEGLSVSLRARGLTFRTALDLLVRNAKDEAGEWVELTWIQQGDDVIRVRPR